LDLTELTDEPEFSATIGGKTYHFSELPIGSLAKLQSWIKANVPDPLVALRSRLEGYPESVVAQLTAEARRETPTWPPIVGSSEAAVALMSTQQGQVYSLWVGLLVHQPAATIEDADRVYRQLKKMRDGKLVKRIFRTIFGTAVSDRDEDEDEDNSPDPKGAAVAVPVPASNGNSTSVQQNSVSR
jgi:hypothetical protein